jgi:hypothetical protein
MMKTDEGSLDSERFLREACSFLPSAAMNLAADSRMNASNL